MHCQDVRMYLCIIIDEYQYFCKMQLRSHAQKYARVQIIHIYIIYTLYVNQRM